MKKKVGVFLLGFMFVFSISKAQLAKKEGITLEAIGKELGELAEKTDSESVQRLEFEARALAASNNESFVNVSVKIFEFLGQTKESEKIEKSIVKRFPKGVKARIEAFNSVFKSQQSVSANVIQKKYDSWLKKFPEDAEIHGEQPIYSQALMRMALEYYNENNFLTGDSLVDVAKHRSNFGQYANWLGAKLIANKNLQAANYVLSNAYEVSSRAIQSTDAAIKNNNDARSFLIIAQNYCQVLNSLKDYETLSNVLTFFITTPHASTTNNALMLGQAFLNQGKKLDAFLAMDNYLRMSNIQGRDQKVIEMLKPLYIELNGPQANFDTYISGIRANVTQVLSSKFKKEMVKVKAADFTLTDLDGHQVSLSDYKGKVVVLEFWATWCSPCKRSLPGMQALVNKYKQDSEVQFLFVDVFQKESNYKELVEKYMIENKYTFKVLFDHMDNYEQSVAKAYAVQGIPHKVVIDKNGFIRFQGTGDLADPEKTVNELSVKIELARGE